MIAYRGQSAMTVTIFTRVPYVCRYSWAWLAQMIAWREKCKSGKSRNARPRIAVLLSMHKTRA